MEHPRNDQKGQKYASVNHLLSTGYFTTLTGLVEECGKMNLVADMPISHKALTRRLANLEYFTLGELQSIAQLIGADPNKISELAFGELKQTSKKRK
jgi:hypothetical protein